MEVDQYADSLSIPPTRNESPRALNGEEEVKKSSLFESGEPCIDDIVTKEASTMVCHEVSMKSVIEGLENVGFDLESDHRISFHHPDKQLYVYVGKVCDHSAADKFRLPKDAFKENGKVS